ncbi:hypothetical protein EO087_04840 [Dyella sp. M7H15-1]|uniref:hypothetical protein n=1 Tax=Dyella sp. M7H15-1 TaxID=2501295 RepID=UPI00100525CD|nr:hypothetical protein [Dyella sp. M7H15-1]QAU23388.1 hypothetical protein EO087_04840 [Dyella sp. M7H15-1]
MATEIGGTYPLPDVPGGQPSGLMFDSLSEMEKREVSRAIQRAEQLATAERTDLELAANALAIVNRLKERGMDDPNARQSAADAISLATANEMALVSQVAECRALLHGNDTPVTFALDKYIHQLREARERDMDALSRLDQSYGSLEGTRRLNEATDEQGRYPVYGAGDTILTTSHTGVAALAMSNNEAVQAFREATTAADRKAAAEKFPELKKAFVVEASMAAMSRQIQGEDAQRAFMSRMRDNIATDIGQGRTLVDIQLRQAALKEEKQFYRDRDRGR